MTTTKLKYYMQKLFSYLRGNKVFQHASLIALSILAVYLLGVFFILGGIALSGLGVALMQWPIDILLGVLLYLLIKDILLG